MTAQGDVRLDEIERLREVLQYVADAPTRVQAWLRAHGVAFENLDDRWQRVGFSLYNEVLEMSAKAKAVLDEEEAEGTKPDAAACQAAGLRGGGGDG